MVTSRCCSFCQENCTHTGVGKDGQARSNVRPLPVEMIIRRLINLDFVHKPAHLYL